MKKKMTIVMFFLLLAMVAFNFAEEIKKPDPNASADEQANANAKFKRTRDLFYSKTNKELRAKWQAEKEAIKAAEAERRAQEAQDKGEGQVKVKF